MTRQSRMLLVMGVIAVVAVVVLAVIARQYSRVATPTRSVADVEPQVATPGAFAGKLAPLEVAPGSASTAAGEDVSNEVPEAESAPDEPALSLDDGTVARLRAFVAGRRAIAAFVEEKPDVALSLVDEAEGYQMGREQIQMHNYDMLGLRVSKVKAIEAAGGTEDAYRSIREQYRLWRDGGDVDPDWARAFDAAGSMLEPADLGRYEPLDF